MKNKIRRLLRNLTYIFFESIHFSSILFIMHFNCYVERSLGPLGLNLAPLAALVTQLLGQMHAKKPLLGVTGLNKLMLCRLIFFPCEFLLVLLALEIALQNGLEDDMAIFIQPYIVPIMALKKYYKSSNALGYFAT